MSFWRSRRVHSSCWDGTRVVTSLDDTIVHPNSGYTKRSRMMRLSVDGRPQLSGPPRRSSSRASAVTLDFIEIQVGLTWRPRKLPNP